MSKQFTQSDPKWAQKDALWWERQLSKALATYKEAKVETIEDRNAKAIAMSTLVGLGNALILHFGSGLVDLVPQDRCYDPTGDQSPIAQACVSAGEAAVKQAQQRYALIEAMVERAQN